MKNLSNNFHELTAGELTGIHGGGFAYDAGRALRFLGIMINNGYNNGVGWSVATLDFVVNML